MTPNPQRGEVEIILDKPRILRLNTNALARAEKIIGKSLLDRQVLLSWDAMRALLFTGLNDPKLTLEKVGDLMDETNKDHLIAAVFEAWALQLGRGSQPQEAGEEENFPKAASSGPGTNS